MIFILSSQLAVGVNYAMQESVSAQMPAKHSANKPFNKKKQKALFDAINLGRTQQAKELLADPKININQFPKNNIWTPILIAAHQGNTEIVKILVEQGANLRVRLKYEQHPGSGYSCQIDRSPSECALANGHHELAHYLEEKEQLSKE